MPPLTMRAAFAPGSLDEQKRTVDVTWTTGARVRRGYFDPYYEELSLDPQSVRMARLNNGAPLCDTHNVYGVRAVLGVVQPGSAKIENGQGRATVRFAKAEDDPGADQVFRKVKDGILQNISVGYRTYKAEKVMDPKSDLPVMRVIDWEPYELSVVPAGEDDGAGFRSVDHAPNACVIVSQERTMDEQKAETSAVESSATETRAAVSEDGTRAAAEAGATAEFERQIGIRRAVRAAKLPETFAEELVSNRTMTLDLARAAVITRLADAHKTETEESHVAVEAGEDESEKFQRGAAASLFSRGMLGQTIRSAQKVEAVADQFRDVSLDPGEFRGTTLLDLARMSLERRGVKTRGLSKMQLVERAFTYRGVSGAQSTSDFALLLENTLHKTLLANYAITPDTWTQFCATRPASDFRPQNLYRNGMFGVLDPLNEHGEFKSKGIPDGEKHSFSIGTKGNIIAITRQAIINDDMGAFVDLAARLGRASKLSIEVDVYATLALNAGLGPTQADGKSLFDAAHGNLNATGSAIGSAGLDADRIVMAGQKDPSGNEILDLRPAILVVPVGLGGQARVINESRFDVDTAGGGFTSSTATKFMLPNRVAGLFRSVVDTPRLSGTRRYLFADPGVAPVLAVAFLDGQQLPYLESDLGWRVDGTEWKIRLDYGVGVVDWRGAVTNAGA